ncbi:hypothetical protein B296_00009436 [Ensete ventricosum]|uniref:Uncharacterized protein n=1 Tax=Ensete ventricosum TaxID=4639 RepID=A0A426ZL05_ENSVE|nr:hypothetical protein B296_00009436 [Ensete ventricosum]
MHKSLSEMDVDLIISSSTNLFVEEDDPSSFVGEVEGGVQGKSPGMLVESVECLVQVAPLYYNKSVEEEKPMRLLKQDVASKVSVSSIIFTTQISQRDVQGSNLIDAQIFKQYELFNSKDKPQKVTTSLSICIHLSRSLSWDSDGRLMLESTSWWSYSRSDSVDGLERVAYPRFEDLVWLASVSDASLSASVSFSLLSWLSDRQCLYQGLSRPMGAPRLDPSDDQVND